MFLFIFDSPTQIIFVVVVLMLLFGASRLPQLAKSLGQSRRAFRAGMSEAEEEEAADREKIATNTAPVAPQITTPPIAHLSDAELEAEMRRRAEARAEH